MNRKIRICHVLSRFDVGGLENGVVNLCNGHNREKFEPSICCVKDTGRMAERLKPDVRIHNLGCPEGKAPLRFLQLRQYFTMIRPDVVHTHGWGAASFDGILGARTAGVPTVINGEHGAFCTKNYQVYIQRFLSMLCNTTLSVSHAHRDKVIETLGLNPNRIRVIHNGVDTDRFTGTCDTALLRKNLTESHGVPFDNDNFVIGCIGSLKPVKNQQLLIRAAAILRRSADFRHKFVILLVGNGPDMLMLKELAVSSGISDITVFAGERSDIPQILSMINLLVLPSQTGKEGLPNVVLEAMSSGIPIVSTRSVGTTEIMLEGETGLFLNSEDPQELSRVLDTFLRNRSKTRDMGLAARSHILAHFSIDRMVAEYEELYRSFAACH